MCNVDLNSAKLNCPSKTWKIMKRFAIIEKFHVLPHIGVPAPGMDPYRIWYNMTGQSISVNQNVTTAFKSNLGDFPATEKSVF